MTMTMEAPQGHTMMATRDGAAPLVFTEEQRRMIRDSFANGASDAEFAVLMEIAKARRLNPLLKQVHFVARWDSQKNREVWATQVSIDGLRAVAERTGLYDGQDEPEFEDGPDGAPKLCRVKVYRKDWPRPAVGVAYWSEYVQTRRDKTTGKQTPTSFWQRMPHTMLAKCAESLALRKAFPEDTSGLYTPEEMGQADNDRPEEQPAPAQRRAKVQREPEVVQGVQGVQGVQEQPAAPALPAQTDLAADIEIQVCRCGTVAQLADLWCAAKADVSGAPAPVRGRAWRLVVQRAVVIGSSEEALRGAITAATKGDGPEGGPDGPRGGSKPVPQGQSTDAHGSAQDGAQGAANDAQASGWWSTRGGIDEHVTKLSAQHIENSARAHAKDFGALREHAVTVYARRHESLRAEGGQPLHDWEARQDVERWIAEGPRAHVVPMPKRASAVRACMEAVS